MSRCRTCGETFDNGFALAVHVDSVHGGEHKCERCGRVFSTKSAYTYHMNHSLSCTDRRQTESTCDICGRTFSSVHGMKMHRRFHDKGFGERVGRKKGVHQTNAQCNTEKARAKKRDTWNRKMADSMRGDGLNEEQIALLLDAEKVRSALSGAKSVSGAAEGIGVDPKYLRRAMDRYGIKTDGLTVHGSMLGDAMRNPKPKRTYQCDECDESFHSRRDLLNHRKSEHRTCRKCGFVADDAEALRRHEIAENGTTCPRCGRFTHRLIELDRCTSCYKKERLVTRTCPQCGCEMHVDMSAGESTICVRCKRRNKSMDCVCPDCGRQFVGSHVGQRCQSCQTKMNRDARPQGVCERCGRGGPVDLIKNGLCHYCRNVDAAKMVFLERYGVDSPFKLDSFQERCRELSAKSRAVSAKTRMDDVVLSYGADPKVVNSKDGLLNLIDTVDHPTIAGLADAAGVPYYMMRARIGRFGLYDRVEHEVSYPQYRWTEDIRPMTESITTETHIYGDNRRKCDLVANGNIGIEINPSSTHYSLSASGDGGCDRDYHYRRSRDAEANGYEVIHVWDWIPKDKMLSFIRSKLHDDDHRISARKCDLVTVDAKTANRFYEANHIQGGLRSGLKVNYALVVDGDEIVAMSSYGKSRFDRSHQWEWLRYCSADGWHVYGGAGRMQKAFIDEHSPKSVVTYTDYSRSNGGMDEALGWSFLRYTGPSLIWWNGTRAVRDSSLLRVGADRILGTHYGPREECGLDNHGIMLNEGYLGIYDCGSKVYELPI